MNDNKEPQKSKDCCDEKQGHHPESCECGGKKKIIFKMPFGRKNIKEMKDFFMLKIVSDHEGEGVTGYELGKSPNMNRGSVIGKLDELKEQGFLTSEESEEDGKIKKKYFITDKGKEQFETLWDTFQETFSFLGEDVPFEHFIKPMFKKHKMKHGHHPHRPNFMHDISQLETKDEVKDFLASMRHRLNIVQKRIEPRLERLKKARTALDEAIAKVDQLGEFSQDEVKKIIEEIRDTYKDVWEHHRK